MEEIIRGLKAQGIKRNYCVMGGEPLCDENAYFTFTTIWRVKYDLPDTLVYVWTGYTFDELLKSDNIYVKEILKYVDHTLLKQESTWEQMKVICDDAIKFSTASVCVPPSFVKQCKDYCGDKMKICTVIGFPNGYNTTAVKVFETEDAIKNGADEIDMVINIGWAKEKKFDLIKEEIKAIKNACGDKILKVIIETCLLSDEEKTDRMSRLLALHRENITAINASYVGKTGGRYRC